MNKQPAIHTETESPGFAVKGDLSFFTVNDVWQRGCDYIEQSQSPLKIDLSAVTHCDSAGVALILDWLRAAKKANKKIVLQQVPSQMQAIVQVSGLTKLIPMQS